MRERLEACEVEQRGSEEEGGARLVESSKALVNGAGGPEKAISYNVVHTILYYCTPVFLRKSILDGQTRIMTVLDGWWQRGEGERVCDSVCTLDRPIGAKSL